MSHERISTDIYFNKTKWCSLLSSISCSQICGEKVYEKYVSSTRIILNKMLYRNILHGSAELIYVTNMYGMTWEWEKPWHAVYFVCKLWFIYQRAVNVIKLHTRQIT